MELWELRVLRTRSRGSMIDTNGSGGIDMVIPTVVIYQGGSVVALHGDTGTPAWTSSSGYGSYATAGGTTAEWPWVT